MMVVLVLILINLNHNICYMCVVSIFRDGPLDRGYDCGSDSRQRSRQCAKAQLLVNHRNNAAKDLLSWYWSSVSPRRYCRTCLLKIVNFQGRWLDRHICFAPPWPGSFFHFHFLGQRLNIQVEVLSLSVNNITSLEDIQVSHLSKNYLCWKIFFWTLCLRIAKYIFDRNLIDCNFLFCQFLMHFQHCCNLKELFVRKNKIAALSEVKFWLKFVSRK